MADQIAALEKLGNALTPLPAAAIAGYQLSVTGTMNIIGGGSGGTSMVDNNAFTPGSTSVTPVAGYHGGRSVASGNAAAVAIDGSGNLQVNVVAGGAGGGVANITVRGSSNSDLHVGYASGAGFNQDGGAYLPILGSVNVGGVVGSVNAVLGTLPVPMVGSVNVQGSLGVGQLAGPWTMVGSVNVTAVSTQTVTFGGNATVWYGGIGADTANSAIRVNVVAGGAGGGAAQMQVIGSDNSTWLNVGQASGRTDLFHAVPVWGTINTVGGGTGFASVAVYGSPANPVYAIGSVNVVNALGVFGSVNVLGTTTLGAIATINMGLGTVNIGNQPNVTATLTGVGITASGALDVDPRANLVATQWIISFGGSGQSAGVAGSIASQRVYFSSYHMVATATVDLQWNSPSGVAISGSFRMLPGAGFALGGVMPAGPVLMGSLGSQIFLAGNAVGNVGGVAVGWIGS